MKKVKCIKCKSDRIISVNGKCSDCFSALYNDIHYNGYVPEIGIGDGGDYIEFDFCLECGQIQGQFPISEEKVIKTLEEGME